MAVMKSKVYNDEMFLGSFFFKMFSMKSLPVRGKVNLSDIISRR